MPRHRTVMTARERWRWLARLVVRAIGWLALGALVGATTWGALTWAGAPPGTRRWVAGAVALVVAVAAGIAASMPRPAAPDEAPQPPPAP